MTDNTPVQADALVEELVTAFEEAGRGYRMELTKLVDGDAEYALTYRDKQTIHDSSEEAYDYLRRLAHAEKIEAARAVLAHQPTTDAEAEPVAWMYDWPGNNDPRFQTYEGMSCNEEDAGMVETPLYAHPPADKERIAEYRRALLMAAPHHQGGHSDTGAAIAEALHVPFPLTMPSLRAAAIDDGFMPYDLWPWLERMEARAALENRDAD